ncbi:MAG: 3D domain-containing protein [Desulfitobacteriaceae bacterium]
MIPWIRTRVFAVVRTSRLAQAVFGALLVAILTITVVLWRAQTIQVQIDNKTVRITTLSKTVGEALAHTSLGIYPEDSVSPPRDTSVAPGLKVEVKRSIPLKLNIDGQVILARSAQADVGKALEELSDRYGLQLKDVDEVNIPRVANLSAGMEVDVKRAVSLHVMVDGKEWDTNLAPRPVSEALGKLGISLGVEDKVSLAPEHIIQAGDKLQVVRVMEKEETIHTEIPYQTVSQPADFPVGLPDRLVTRGSNGAQEQTVKLVLEDGKEVRREVLSQKIMRPPVNQVVSRGAQTSVSRGGKVISFQRAYLMRATAYSEPGGTTAIGVPVQWGVVAVDPRVIRLGTKLYVDGYGDATALDTGGAIKGNRIDLYMDSEDAASNWGVRTVIVYVL